VVDSCPGQTIATSDDDGASFGGSNEHQDAPTQLLGINSTYDCIGWMYVTESEVGARLQDVPQLSSVTKDGRERNQTVTSGPSSSFYL